ncbi:hypothetical protein [Paenibacillus crassostreae]
MIFTSEEKQFAVALKSIARNLEIKEYIQQSLNFIRCFKGQLSDL